MLTEQTLRSGTTAIKTSRKANCFGAGTAGSGKSVTVRGATALGLFATASKSTASLRPLLVTDAFDFGLGICGAGGSKVSGKASWYLKVNHKGATVGGDAVKLKPGDEVLWDLAPSYPYPNELGLIVPVGVTAGVPFQVRVVSYDEKGKRKPVRRRDGNRRRRPDRCRRQGDRDAQRVRRAGRDPRQGHPLARRGSLHRHRLPGRPV